MHYTCNVQTSNTHLRRNLTLVSFFVCTCSFWIGDAADRQKMQEEDEERKFPLWTLHVDCDGTPAWDSLSIKTEMANR